MRVLISIMVFHPVVGGTEASAKDLAAALARQGHAVDVVTLRHPGLPSRQVLDGVTVHRVLLGIGRGAIFALSYVLSLTWFLLRHRRYDVIQVYFAYLDAVAVSLLKPFLRARTVVRLAGGGLAGDLARLRRIGLEPLLLPWIKRLDRFVVVSRQMRGELLQAGFDEKRIAVIPNGVDVERFSGSAGWLTDRSTVQAARHTAVTVTRLSPEKGVDLLLEAWGLVHAQVPEARLVVVGDGPQRTALERQADRLGLNAAVQFIGEVPDVLPYLRASDVFVLSSRSEGLPNALLQAMAVGLPCIATRVGGIPELIEDGVNGRLVAPEHPGALAETLLSVFGNPLEADRYGTAARQTMASCHTFEVMVERYLGVYRELIESPPPGDRATPPLVAVKGS